MTSPDILDRVLALRAEFDSAFAAPLRPARDQWTDLLTIRVGTTPYALRADELAGLHVDKTVTAVPGAPAAVRGLAGFRGSVVVVWDLAVLLGGAAEPGARWIVVAAADPEAAFSFGGFDGHVRVDGAAIAPDDDTSPHPTVSVDGVVRTIVALPALLAEISKSNGGLK